MMTLLSVGFLLVVFDTVRKKGRFGLNFNKVLCAKCGEKMPTPRKPTSIRQTLWGGWTCSVCKCEMNIWGKEINMDEIGTAQNKIREAQVNLVEPFDREGKTPVEKIFEDNNK